MEGLPRKIFCVENAHACIFLNEMWLPLETVYPHVLDELRRGRKLAQVVLLEGGHGVTSLIKEAWAFILREGIDYVFILVNPDSRRRWERLHFQDTGWGIRKWNFVDFLPVLPMRLDVGSVRLTDTEKKHFGVKK